jgi:hypothetical protein
MVMVFRASGLREGRPEHAVLDVSGLAALLFDPTMKTR